ncbi:hypothetical protein K503DRAFT_772630 [Rhizopogon vinicolor AM-OR11-026]|uniref:Uncharacterized protein n=1 Tax=Rhizopogon vinicolor AM-OR11-026 TaxID=1314800 RepID=A0A1B7MUR5_9AGAM|nr:hypothetical protein K503DRAFT_772630 [Rhizopogon vinicolor AM-OR11-026]
MVPSQLFVSQSGVFHQDHKGQSVMLQKHTEQSHFIVLNGQGSSSASQELTILLSTQPFALALHHQLGLMVTSLMQVQTSCAPMNSWKNIIPDDGNGLERLPRMIVSSSQGDENGIKGQLCPMTHQKNLMKTLLSRSRTYHLAHPAHQKMRSSHTAWKTLTTSPQRLAYHGNYRKTRLSPSSPHSLVSFGIYPAAPCSFPKRNGLSISKLSFPGNRNAHTHWMRYKSYMENSCMHPLLSPLVARTSRTSKACWEPLDSDLLFLVHPPATPQLTSSGGRMSSTPPIPFLAPSPALASSTISTPIRTLALAMALASPSGVDGGLGASSQDGNAMDATSAGLKALVSNSSSAQSSLLMPPEFILRSMVTIAGSSKDGGRVAAEAKPATKYSSVFIRSLPVPNAQFLQDTYQARTIQPTDLREGYTPPQACCFQKSQSPQSSTLSSPTYQTTPSLPNVNLPIAPNCFTQWSKTMSNLSSSNVHSSTENSNAEAKNSFRHRKSTYTHDLTPAPSILRPHCAAKDRLHLWIPTSSRSQRDAEGRIVPLTAADILRIQDVIVHAYAEGTRESYGSGLLVYHVFCDSKAIPEDQRAPASQILISSFISCMAGNYSGKTISNYVHGVRAWHILHGAAWVLIDMEIDALLKAAYSLTPASSKRSKREPYTIDLIIAIHDRLNLNEPLDVARTVQDRQSLITTNFHLPRTKSAQGGENVFWAKQLGPSDPQEAFLTHLRINNPPAGGALFAYRHKEDMYRPLTKSKFLSRLSAATKAANRTPVQGHGIRIGATLEYLLRNVPFDVVKAKGRWASDAFLLYLRRHAQVMAPYMQATPIIHEQFLHHTMPPVR